MEFDLFNTLDGASPWWWIAFAFLIGAVEMATVTYFLIWFALSAFTTGIVMWLGGPLSGQSQLIWFAALSVAITVIGRISLKYTRATPTENPGLNRRSEQLIGRKGKALEDFDDGEGVVIVDDVRWRARLAIGAAGKGDHLVVIDADGMQLICEPA
ncbi:MAG: NfeD family protein [Pseudomonadota bacterium]